MAVKRKLQEIFSHHYRKRDALIPILQDIQGEFGYLPPEAMDAAARFCRIDPVEVYGRGDLLRAVQVQPDRKNVVMVCQGTACHVMGGARILQEVKSQLGVRPGETTRTLYSHWRRWRASAPVPWRRPWLSTRIHTAE